jgi:hypothetical protein
MRIIGIILLVLGIIMIVSKGFNFRIKKEIVDTGTIEINKRETKTITWPWFAGGIFIVGGIAFLLIGKRRTQ